MTSYKEKINNIYFLIVEIDAGKCKTTKGFLKEMIEGFALPLDTPLNINSIGGYLFSDYLAEHNFKILIKNSKGLKQKDEKQFNLIIGKLKTWKEYWEGENPSKNHFLIEIQ